MTKQPSILDNLDQFIRKYYKNRMIRGIIYAITLLVSLFLVIALLEHFGYFGTLVRALFFWGYLVAAMLILGYYVLVPLCQIFRLGRRISYKEAARIVGSHFPEIKDKLLNLLQLQAMDSDTAGDLLCAAIEQKTSQLSPIPFHQAVNLKDNRRYLKYAAIPIAVALLLLLLSPTLLTAPSHRIAHYGTCFERPAPFSFLIENDALEAVQQADFELRVAILGDALPAEVFINVEGNIYRMQAMDKSHFVYTFRTLQRSCSFHLEAAGVHSPEFTLMVCPKPSVVSFQTLLSYPAYTGKIPETLSDEGDLSIPQGTYVKWNFFTHDVDTLFFFIDDGVRTLFPDENGRISLTIRAMQSFQYGFCPANSYALHSDTLRYAVSVIEDALPMIAVQEMRDSTYTDRLFFQGRIKDDYGFTRLEFKTLKTNVQDTSVKVSSSTGIGITRETAQEFLYSLNLAEVQLNPGDKLTYYFEVWDNDAIHGPKSVTSQQFELLIPTEQELDNILDRNAVEAQQQAQQSVSELRKMQQEIDELMRKLVDKKELNWQDKKDLQELSKKQQEVKSMLQHMQQQLNENKQLEQKYREHSEQLMEKQRELDRLMNEVMTEEMKQMMQEIDQMMQELDKKKVQEQLEQMKLDNEQLEKQLDQNIELMKRLEMEKKVEDAVHKAETLAREQRQLSEMTDQARSREERERLLDRQQQLSQQFNELKKDIQDIQQGYKDIDKNLNFNADKQLQEQIGQKQQSAQDKMSKGKNKEASQQQQSAADDLDQLAEQLAEAQTDLEQQDLAEDAEMIRHLLKNLVHLSFNQEQLISDVRNTYIQDPKYQSIIYSQNRLREDFRIVEDSLRAVAHRQIAVAVVINRNLSDINNNLDRTRSTLLDMNQTFYGNYKNQQVSQPMQYAMTSFNNLALVLAESLDKMQQEMRQNQQRKSQGSCKNKSNMKKSGNCSNPGNGKPSAKSMKEMQKELNRQMEALKKQLDKQGKAQNSRKKIGDRAGSQMSEEFARMAAQQEMIRRMMQQYGQELKQGDAGNAKLTREIDQMMKQMEQTETDLVNRVITQQTIKRQQQIMSRLLEHEKAEMEREKEDRRKSNEGHDISHQPSSADLEKYERLKENSTDLFRTTPPTLSPFYKSKVDDYFYSPLPTVK